MDAFFFWMDSRTRTKVEITRSSNWKSSAARSGWIFNSRASSLPTSRSWNEILAALGMALVQLRPEILHQWQHPELLEGAVGFHGLVILAAPGGQSNEPPVGRPIAGPAESFRVNE